MILKNKNYFFKEKKKIITKYKFNLFKKIKNKFNKNYFYKLIQNKNQC